MINGSLDPNAGEVSLTLNDDEYLTLRPTLRNAQMISRRCGGLAKARQALIDEDIDVIVFIIRTASGMTDRDARTLEDRVWRNGYNNGLVMPLFNYIAILNNGGKPLPEDLQAVFNVVDDGSSRKRVEDYSQDHDSGNG